MITKDAYRWLLASALSLAFACGEVEAVESGAIFPGDMIFIFVDGCDASGSCVDAFGGSSNSGPFTLTVTAAPPGACPF
jgi:hypothetical protein